MKTLLLSLATATLLALGPHTASATTAACAERDQILERLNSAYGETRQSIGLGANNALVEVFASEKTGTWTITVMIPGGKTCLIASGQSYEALAEDLPAAGNDA